MTSKVDDLVLLVLAILFALALGLSGCQGDDLRGIPDEFRLQDGTRCIKHESDVYCEWRRWPTSDSPWIEEEEEPTPTHNQHGGWIASCGDNPPLVGDDC